MALLVFVVLVLAVFGILGRLAREAGRDGGGVRDARGRVIQFRYDAAPLLVSKGEKTIWALLHELNLGQVAVCPKVRLEDIVSVRASLSVGHTQQLRGYTRSRHVDFLLVNERLMPMLVVEVDGPHHTQRGQRWRDAVVDGALHSAGIPVLRLHYGEDWRNRLLHWREFAAGAPPAPAPERASAAH